MLRPIRLAGYRDRRPRAQVRFLLIYAITVAHGLHILWHVFPKEQQACILRQYALFAIMMYICQLSPAFDVDIIDSIQTVELVGQCDWEAVVDETLEHRWFRDSHFFKVVRAPKEFEETYGKKDGFYLKAAVKFLAEFDGWEGFGLGIGGFVPSRDEYKPE